MAILFHCPSPSRQVWLDNLRLNAGDTEIRVWPDAGDRADITFAAVFGMPPGSLATFPNLKGICSLGAGVDHLLADPDLPRDVPIARLVDPVMADRMAEYVTAHALNHHLSTMEYAAQQAAGVWARLPYRDARERTATVVGLGILGRRCAGLLRDVGFRVTGWSRTPRAIEGIETAAGTDALDRLLAGAEIVVLVLPSTAGTRDLLDARRIALLPPGAAVINVARGELVDEGALLAALDDRPLSGATLDVFRTEPPPADHPYWRHPKVRLTPHISSLSEPTSGVRIVYQQYLRLMRGLPMTDLVDPGLGY